MSKQLPQSIASQPRTPSASVSGSISGSGRIVTFYLVGFMSFFSFQGRSGPALAVYLAQFTCGWRFLSFALAVRQGLEQVQRDSVSIKAEASWWVSEVAVRSPDCAISNKPKGGTNGMPAEESDRSTRFGQGLYRVPDRCERSNERMRYTNNSRQRRGTPCMGGALCQREQLQPLYMKHPLFRLVLFPK